MSSPFEREMAPAPEEPGDELPAYAEALAAYHRSHETELQHLIEGLPLRPGHDVLDVACGDGAYACWLARRVGPAGHVAALDLSRAYLEVAGARARAEGMAEQVHLRLGASEALPFADEQFDLVWCAQSMYTLPDPRAALAEMARVARPGGAVAIFENDLLHHILLPWPRELGQAIDEAQREALAESDAAARGHTVVSDLCGALAGVGLHDRRLTISTTVHRGPFSADERLYLGSYLDDLRSRARPRLGREMRAELDRLSLPHSGAYLLDQPQISAVYINLVGQGVKPARP